jgi:hypothetical protein
MQGDRKFGFHGLKDHKTWLRSVCWQKGWGPWSGSGQPLEMAAKDSLLLEIAAVSGERSTFQLCR